MLLLREAFELSSQSLARDDSELIKLKYSLARAYEAIGHLQDAMTLFEEVYDIRKQSLPANNAFLLAAQSELARLYLKNGRTKKLSSCQRRC